MNEKGETRHGGREPRSNLFPLAVLLSGGGRSLQNLIYRSGPETPERARLPVEIRLVVSSRSDAGGLAIAAAAGIPTVTLRRCDFASTASYSDAVFAEARSAGAGLVVMAGFLCHLLIPADFQGRVINIHPSLIPAFSGQGFYGARVHEAVLEAGARVSGCTVHFVDDHYDHGPIILQRTVPVLDDDSAETLAARVFQEECQALPEAIRRLIAGEVRIDGERIRLSSPAAENTA